MSPPPQVVLKSQDDQVTVIGAGVTLHEALAAADLLKKGEEGGTPSLKLGADCTTRS